LISVAIDCDYWYN